MKGKIFSSLALLTAVFCDLTSASTGLSRAKALHRPKELEDYNVKSISLKTDMGHFNEVLDKILVPRVVGTPQHKKVGNYIVSQMESLGWTVELDTFKDVTPTFGELEFRNIIAKLNPAADRFLVISCHYDSKHMRENTFVGATDSAVPCAMMINMAKTLEKELSLHNRSKHDVSLAFLFFDGEEAFKTWSATDSIYGARHLAKKWDNEKSPLSDGSHVRHLEKIDIMVLLDLLGTKNPKFYSYFHNTEKWYARLVEIEERLSEMGQLRGYSPRNKYFQNRAVNAYIEDDHIPFLTRNVPILHIIPSPFPSVWHKPTDNRAALDMNTIENLNKIFRVFLCEYLGLDL